MMTENENDGGVKIRVIFDAEETAQKIKDRIKLVQGRLDARVLQDSNYYCPLDTGMLQKSGILHTVVGSGKVIWKTPYARRQYYEENNKSLRRNPHACSKWFEAAKARNIKTWEKMTQEEYNKL